MGILLTAIQLLQILLKLSFVVYFLICRYSLKKIYSKNDALPAKSFI